MHANRHTMVSKRDQILLAVGTALVLGVTFLPVPENAVRAIAEESLVRTQVSRFQKSGLGHETPVNLYQLDAIRGCICNAINTILALFSIPTTRKSPCLPLYLTPRLVTRSASLYRKLVAM